MPTRTSTASATQLVEADNDGGLDRLQFSEPLSWRAGKPIAVAELLRRLQALSKEMRGMEQDTCDKTSFTTVARELSSPNLLSHKDNGIKAWTASCLVDILRLCAPDAPYTGQQLKEIFQMIITTIIPALGAPGNAYFQQQSYVIKSLEEVKSIVLLTDIPSSDRLITHLFISAFDVLATSRSSSSEEQVGKHLEITLTSLLVTMVDEAQSLPSEVIDVVVAQFLRTDPRVLKGPNEKSKKNKGAAVEDNQSTLTLKDFPPSYNMAKTICNSCQDKMARYISQYFNDVVVDASSSKAPSKKIANRRISEDFADDTMDLDGTPSEDDLRELRKVHSLLRELWRACPAVLQNIVPQLEAELSAENVSLRLLATETLGDIVAGIGSAGLPPTPEFDSTSFPPPSMAELQESIQSQDVLTKPSSPQPFSQVHPKAYSSFVTRYHDRSSIIRAAWATCVGRILTTAAGGVGLNKIEEENLITGLTKALGDADEKVRMAAVQAVGTFSFTQTVNILGTSGGLSKPGSLLSVLAERVRDRRPAVRKDAMTILARMWGQASGEITAGNEEVQSILGSAPSKILDTYYANDLDINALLDHVLFEELLPLGFPAKKTKSAKPTNGASQNMVEDHTKADAGVDATDPDQTRVERILVLAKGLEERAKKVFFVLQPRQLVLSKVMAVYLQRCEDFNGGVMDGNEKEIKSHLGRLIENLARGMPNSSKVAEHLWKFAKMHDRRSYQLIRFCMAPESDYRTVQKAFKEFCKRLKNLSNSNNQSELLDSMTPLLYRVSVIIYNKSHVPAIMQFSRSDEKSLAGTAHELLREISTQTAEVLKAHVKEICKALQEEAPNAKNKATSGSLDNLKACASFASKFPDEIPKDRTFVQAIQSYALHGKPPEAAKHAVSILMTSSGKKEMIANDVLQKCIKSYKFGGEGFLARLAALSQLILLAPDEVNAEADAVSSIAIEKTLLQAQQPSQEAADAYEWSDEVDLELEAKCWALKILVNRVRSHSEPDTLKEVATPVYKLLHTLITQNGEILPERNTPPAHKSRLRLLAARLVLKLGLKKHTDGLISPEFFNALAVVAQDPRLPVRTSFLERLKKYVNRQRLGQRYYTIPFLLAFEPSQNLKSDMTTWIRSRVTHFANLRSDQASPRPPPVMESVFARLLSLLAHHPDYGPDERDLLDFARYMTFYLQTVATEQNLSLIYQIAQRVKQCSDALSPPSKAKSSSPFDENLYHLSDLAQLTIRKFEDVHDWNVETLPGKIKLPTSLFIEIRDHTQAQQIAERNYLPEGLEEGVENLVKRSLRSSRHTNASNPQSSKKRRSDVDHQRNGPSKKAKSSSSSSLPIREPGRAKRTGTKTPKKNRSFDAGTTSSSTEPRRRSGRVSTSEHGRYAERDDDEDDKEMLGEGVAKWKYEGDDIAEEEEDEDDEEQEEDDDHEADEEEEEGGMNGKDNEPEPEPEEEAVVSPAPDQVDGAAASSPPTSTSTRKRGAAAKAGGGRRGKTAAAGATAASKTSADTVSETKNARSSRSTRRGRA